MATLSGSSRTPIAEPDFIPQTLVDDSTAISGASKVFYQYQFGSKEDDWKMTPKWALANLYHGGIRVIEAWYVRSTTPRSHRTFETATLYGPFFVVGLAQEDSYMQHFRYRKLETFDPIKVSEGLLGRMTHYVSE